MFYGRVIGPDDPQWLDGDRDLVRAYETAMADVCRKCGTRQSLWEGNPYPPPYVGQQHKCRGCEALAQEQKNVPDGTDHHTTAFLAPFHLASEHDVPEVAAGRA